MSEPCEIVFEVTKAIVGGYEDRAQNHSIFTRREDLDDLKSMVIDSILSHIDDDGMAGESG